MKLEDLEAGMRKLRRAMVGFWGRDSGVARKAMDRMMDISRLRCCVVTQQQNSQTTFFISYIQTEFG